MSRTALVGIASIAIAGLAVALGQRVLRSGSGRHLAKEDLGSAWPFTVSEGTVRCLERRAVIFEANTKRYAVNGTAKGYAKHGGFLPIESIWAEDPKFLERANEVARVQRRPIAEVIDTMGPPTRIDIKPILEIGLALCR